MGIWDYISWSTDSLKGLGSSVITKGKEFSADALQKMNHHGSAAITNGKEVSVNALQKVNHHGSAAITKGKEESVNALQKVNHHIYDPQTRSIISRVVTEVAKNAIVEGFKLVPGLYPTYKIVSKSIDDADKKVKTENKTEKQVDDLKTLLATVSKLEKEVDVLRQQLAKQAIDMKPCDKPEGTNPVHLVKEFILAISRR